MANVQRLIAGLLLWLVAGVAGASIMPSSLYGYLSTALSYSSPGDACAARAASLVGTNGITGASVISAVAGTAGCVIHETWTGGAPFDTSYNIFQSAVSCPVNSTGTTSCTCNTGYVESAGACVPAPPVCHGGQSYSSGSSRVIGTGSTFPAGATGALFQAQPKCDGGCAVAADGPSIYAGRSAGANVWTLYLPALTYTGANCTTSDADLAVDSNWAAAKEHDLAPSTCATGQCPGTVNGTNVCVPCGAVAAPSSTSSSSSTTAATGGSGGATGGSTTNGNGSGSGATIIGSSGPKNSGDTQLTVCDGSTCTTTTTSTGTAGAPSGAASGAAGGTGTGGANGNGASSTQCAQAAAATASAAAGGATCTTTTTSTASQATYCADHKTDVACTNDSSHSSFGGDCAAGFTASGDDAVKNAMAQEVFKRDCQFFATTGPNVTAVAGYALLTGKQTGDLPGSVTNDISALDQTDLLGSGGGPPALSFSMLGQTVALPMDHVTTGANWLGMIMLAVTSIACVMIVFGYDL